MARQILTRFDPDKKSTSVRQVDGPKNFNPIWPRQKIGSSTTKTQLVYGKFKKAISVCDD